MYLVKTKNLKIATDKSGRPKLANLTSLADRSSGGTAFAPLVISGGTPVHPFSGPSCTMFSGPGCTIFLPPGAPFLGPGCTPFLVHICPVCTLFLVHLFQGGARIRFLAALKIFATRRTCSKDPK